MRQAFENLPLAALPRLVIGIFETPAEYLTCEKMFR